MKTCQKQAAVYLKAQMNKTARFEVSRSLPFSCGQIDVGF